MYDHEIRWSALIPLSLALGLVVLGVETTGVWGAFPVRPDWFWVLAFFAAMRALPVSSICVFAWCGFARDMLLGPRPGAASIAFILIGWIALYWKPLAATRGWFGQALAVGMSAFLVGVVKSCLDAGWMFAGMVDSIFFISLGIGMLSGVLFIPAAIFLSVGPFRPWRERTGLFL
jgi:hypothetical protein